MMQGDQYKIPIELKNDDGSTVTQKDLKNLEVFVGNVRKLLSRGEIEFEEINGLFYVFVSQKETFRLRGDVKVQARLLLLSGDVVGVNLGTVNFEESTSKVVLE